MGSMGIRPPSAYQSDPSTFSCVCGPFPTVCCTVKQPLMTIPPTTTNDHSIFLNPMASLLLTVDSRPSTVDGRLLSQRPRLHLPVLDDASRVVLLEGERALPEVVVGPVHDHLAVDLDDDVVPDRGDLLGEPGLTLRHQAGEDLLAVVEAPGAD